ncbi:MAG: hypothetical protein GXP29_06625 [Planctomycetes bacterium]|nr:hypothetical protein [Planctomycetota bacterium]
MSKKNYSTRRTIHGVVAAVAILAVALPVLADCGKCAKDGKALAESVKSGKVNLVKAATMAEAATKGVAVRAMVHQHADGNFVEVHCIAGDKIMAVQVDCATGKMGEPAEVKDLESHAPASEGAGDEAAGESADAGESAEAPSDADVQTKLDDITKATKAGELGSAEESLTQLENLKNLSDTMQGKVKAARQAMDAARAASKLKKGLPSLP